MLRQRWLEQLGQDLRYAARMLRRSPGFTAVAVLSLAFAIGANTAIFSLIDALMLRNLPVQSPEQLVYIYETGRRTTYDFPHPTFQKFSELTQVFSGVSANWLIDRSNVTANGPTGGLDDGRVRVGLASGNYFSNLGVNAVIGRTFTQDDDRVEGGHPVAVMSYGYWERRFARAPDVVGRTLTLYGTTYDIIGVTGRGFTGDWAGKPTDLWIPFMMHSQVIPELRGGLQRLPTLIIGRLNPGVTGEQAQAACQVLFQQLLRDEAGPNSTPQRLQQIAQQQIQLEPAGQGHSPRRQSQSRPLTILMIVVGAVLLIACANVANLLLARSSARQREMAVRLALGAGRGRIVRQLLTESVLIATMGGALGLVLAIWGTNVLTSTMASGPASIRNDIYPPFLVGVSLDVHLDARIFAFTAAVCLLTGILFGLAPGFRSSKTSIAPALTGRGAGSGSSGGKFGPRNALVISQVALSLILLIGAGLFARTLYKLKGQDLGWDREHVLLVSTAPVQTGRADAELPDFGRTMLERLSSLPGVRSATMSVGGMLNGSDGGDSSEALKIADQTPKAGLILGRVTVAPGFFETVGVPLFAGRDFTEQDTDKAPRVAIISETMARFFFGNENPIGKRFGWRGDAGYGTEIVGVAKDAKYGTLRDERGIYYVPYRQSERFLRAMWCVAVRAVGNPSGLAARVRQELREVDPNLPVLRINTAEDQLNDVLVQERLIATLSGFFGALGVLLACLGLYGVISYTVTRRTNEIGIRLALGGTPADVLRMVLRESILLVLAGIVIGVPGTLAATSFLSSLLFGISSSDTLTIVGASLLMIAIAGLAGFLPARRASRVDPMVALRYE